MIINNYIIEFDIAAAFLLVLLLVVFFLHPTVDSYSKHYFLAVLIILFLASVSDAIGSYIINLKTSRFWLLSYITNGAYITLIGMVAPAFANYVMSFREELDNRAYIKRIVMNVITSVLVVLDTTSPITHFMYYLKPDGSYHHGPLMIVQYVVAFFVLIYVFAFSLRHKKNWNNMQWIGALSFCSLVMVAFIIQYFIPLLLITCFVAAVSMAYLTFTVENPGDLTNAVVGCYNRTALEKYVNMSIGRRKKFSVVVFGVEEYDTTCRNLGEDIVNYAIRQGVDALRKAFGTRNVFYLENCRFAIKVPETEPDAKNDIIASRIMEYFKKSINFGIIKSKFTPYIIIAPLYDNVMTAKDYTTVVLNCLDTHRGGKGDYVTHLRRDDFEGIGRTQQIISAIRKAIINDGFEVYYQPILDTRTNKFTSAEALVRLIDSDLGFVSPEEFIPISEETGQIIAIGEIVFRKVCSFIHEYNITSYGIKYIEVNLSPVQCMDESLHESMRRIMDQYDIRPEWINFEITETAYGDEKALSDNMSSLIDYGTSFSMDDYGTGYSNVSLLTQIPLSIVKVDKGILWIAMKDERAKILLKHSIEAIHDLNMNVVVEGVEDENMVELLTTMGVEYFQGFYYSRPIKEEDFFDFIRV